MGKGQREKQLRQWHPAFYAGIQIEFSDEADKLYFENEHQLGTKPKAVDVLIIKKDTDRAIRKNIGRIFRTHNIVEYKCPGDYLSIDDYYKVLGYACFYKADASRVDAVKASDITVSYVCRNRPRKLEKFLTGQRCLKLQKLENGIYHIKGELFPVQFICTSELSPDKNIWLKCLTDDLEQGEQVERLLREYRRHQKNSLYRSVMNMVVRANWEIFEEEKGMCEALIELFGEELTTAVAAGIADGIKEQLPIAVEERVAEIIDERMAAAVEERMAEAVEERVSEVVEERVASAVEERVAEARQEIRQEGINALIADNMEEGFSVDRILGKLEKRFGLTALEAQDYFRQFAASC